MGDQSYFAYGSNLDGTDDVAQEAVPGGLDQPAEAMVPATCATSLGWLTPGYQMVLNYEQARRERLLQWEQGVQAPDICPHCGTENDAFAEAWTCPRCSELIPAGKCSGCCPMCAMPRVMQGRSKKCIRCEWTLGLDPESSAGLKRKAALEKKWRSWSDNESFRGTLASHGFESVFLHHIRMGRNPLWVLWRVLWISNAISWLVTVLLMVGVWWIYGWKAALCLPVLSWLMRVLIDLILFGSGPIPGGHLSVCISNKVNKVQNVTVVVLAVVTGLLYIGLRLFK